MSGALGRFNWLIRISIAAHYRGGTDIEVEPVNASRIAAAFEMSLANLLAPEKCIELHHLHSAGIIKIGSRRVVERDTSIRAAASRAE